MVASAWNELQENVWYRWIMPDSMKQGMHDRAFVDATRQYVSMTIIWHAFHFHSHLACQNMDPSGPIQQNIFMHVYILHTLIQVSYNLTVCQQLYGK